MPTLVDITIALDRLWASRKIMPQWLDYETTIDLIYHSTLTPAQREAASMEALDAVTRRGHFDSKSYLTAGRE